MIDDIKKQALMEAYISAKLSQHIFPQIAACEVMEESSWGASKLFHLYNNCFGLKQLKTPIFKTCTLPTWEIVNGVRENIDADFVYFPSKIDSFNARMKVLMNNPTIYGTAIAARTPFEFIMEVCGYRDNEGKYHGRWSTDPERATTVLSIYNAHKDMLL